MNVLLINECKELLDAYRTFFEANEHNYFSTMCILCELGEKK